MHYTFVPSGVCAKRIDFDLEDGRIRNLHFEGGCNGNLKAISKLVEGRRADETAELLRGNTCGPKSTSCADQLSIGLEKAINGEL